MVVTLERSNFILAACGSSISRGGSYNGPTHFQRLTV